MSEELYNLSTLQAHFKQLQADKKKAIMKTLQFVLELNKKIKIDEILIRQGFETYPNKVQLQKVQKKKVFKQYQQFFKHMVQNLDTIQQHYLKESNDKEQIDQASKDQESEYNYFVNKNSISKFVRDEANHYQNTIDKYLESTGEDEEKGIKTSKMHSFFIELFKNDNTCIIKDQGNFLKQPQEQIAIHIGNTLVNYAQQVKAMSAQEAQNQFSINQQEVLDFLTFWLKQEAQNFLFVLYARTTQRLQNQSKILLNKSNLQVKMHPSRMTKDEIKLMEKEQEEAGQKLSEQLVDKSQAEEKQSIKEELPKQDSTIKFSSISNNYSALSLLRSRQYQVQQQLTPVKQPPRELTKEEKLQTQMKNLFKFGCKRRYKVTKNNTFQELQFQLTNMSLQKFINFCTFFQIQKIISRDLLIQYFKLFAINRRNLDQSRFEQLISKLIKTDSRVLDNLLEKVKYDVKSKKNQIKLYKKNEGKLSDYKFKLRPVNGKDISTIEKELTFRKLEKQIDRQEKDQKALLKRENLQKTKANVKSISNFGGSRLDISRFETKKEPSFNPENLITFEKDHDDLWNAYEAKIWKKEVKKSGNTLEDILSKRINKGHSIISKINSQRSMLYE